MMNLLGAGKESTNIEGCNEICYAQNALVVEPVFVKKEPCLGECQKLGNETIGNILLTRILLSLMADDFTRQWRTPQE